MINDVAEEEESVSAARKSGLLGNKFKSGLCVDTHTSKRAKHELVYCSDYLRLPTTAYESRTNDTHPTTTHHLNPFTAPTDASTTATITINPSTIAQHIHFLVFRCETLAA